MVAAPELVLFGIQAALRLYAGAREAYVNDTRDRALILPLPQAPDNMTREAIAEWFTEHDQVKLIVAENLDIKALMTPPLKPGDDAARIALHTVYSREFGLPPGPVTPATPRPPDQSPTARELTSLLTVRQWAKGENVGQPTALQLVAGSLIDVAVEYFATMPGAVSQNRPEGRILLAFLTALNERKVANKLEFARTPVSKLADSLLVSVLDAATGIPEILIAGKKERLLVTGITTALADAIDDTLAIGLSETERRDASDWVQVLAAAALRGAKDTVLAHPALFLPGDDGAGSKVLQKVIGEIATLAIGKNKVEFQNLFSEKGLTTIVRAALNAVAANPGIIDIDNPGLKKLILEIVQSLGESKLPAAKDLAPEVLRLILDRSAANLDLIWQGDRSDPGRNLLVTASQQTLLAFAQSLPAGGKPWGFSHDQLLSVLDAVFAEVQENPDWVVKKITPDPTLQAALMAALGAMAGRAPSGIGLELVRDILTASLTAVGLRLELLKNVPAGDKEAGKTWLAAIIGAVFSAVFSDELSAEQRWRLARADVIRTLVQAALHVLARKGVDLPGLGKLRGALDELTKGKLPPADFMAILEQKLAA